MRRLALLFSLFALLAARPALAEDLRISEAWAQGTVTGQTVTGVFMRVDAQRAALLIGAHSPAAAQVEFFEMERAGRGPLAPQRVTQLILKRGTNLLTPVTAHLSLTGLQRTIHAGDRIPLTLDFQFGDGTRASLTVTVSGRDFYPRGTDGR